MFFLFPAILVYISFAYLSMLYRKPTKCTRKNSVIFACLALSALLALIVWGIGRNFA